MEYKEFALQIAQEAGAIIRSNFALGMKKEWKADASPVTETDLAINKRLIEAVKQYFSGHSVFGEEQSALIKGSEYLWVCDPVDGTIPFSHGIPTCMFSLAFVHNGESILGVIYDPFMDRLLWAEKGSGAFLNGEAIHVSTQDLGDRTLVAVPLWVNALGVDPGRPVNSLHKRKTKTLDVGFMVYQGMLVAIGELGAALFAGQSFHDIAALKIIVEEAGGKVTDLYGNDQPYDRPIKGAIVSNGTTHAPLVEIFKELLS